MNTILLRILSVVLLGLALNLQAQVPSMLNYQGRIAVSGVNFTGATISGNNGSLMLTDPLGTGARAFYQVRIDVP